MNTALLVLAIVCLVLAVYGACRKDVPTAAAGATGAVLFALLAIMTGEKDRYDRDC
jgi:hypothetical protein